MTRTSFQDVLFPIDTDDAAPAPMVLTVRQPWAYAIIHAGKDIENRSRTTHYRGRLLIHAGKAWAPQGAQWLNRMGIPIPDDLPTGCIIGSVTVTGSTQNSSSPWAMPDSHHWQFTDPTAARELIYCRGSLAMFSAPAGWESAFTPVPAAGIRSCA